MLFRSWPRDIEEKEIWLKQAHEELDRAREEARSLGAIAGSARIYNDIAKKITSGKL